jgi:protein TonB
MHERKPIVSAPMLIGVVLSIALHGAALYSRGIYTPPLPTLEQGRTVVHLTLTPSVASQASTPEPPIEKQVKEPSETPALIPVPIPVAKPAEPLPSLETAVVDSPEQDASLQEDKGITSEAALAGSFRPPYPRISKLRGETGSVTLSILVRPDGSVEHVSMQQSSGYRRLDEAALKAARKTTFTPAMRFGRAMESETKLSFTFRLTDD